MIHLIFESEENYISKWVFKFLCMVQVGPCNCIEYSISASTLLIYGISYAWNLKLLSKHVRDGFNLIEFDFFPFQVLHLFGNFVHGISLDLQLVEYLQLFEFAHFIQCKSLIHACTEEISVHIGISKELAGILDQRFPSLECYQNVWKSINSN